MRGEMIRDSSGAKEKEEALFFPPSLSFNAAKMIQVELLKEAFRLPGGNVIPAHRSRVTQGGMRGIKGGLGGEEARQSR